MIDKISLNNISKDYGEFKLGEISFSIPKGYVTGFIGRNGAGKTTTIKSILSLINFNSDIFIDDISNKDRKYLQKVGVVMDDAFLGKDWNMELVNTAMKIGYDEWNEAVFKNYLDRFGISPKLKVKELSRGMKIKLMLSIALSHKADTLILDEPTSSLDPKMRDEFTDILQEYVDNKENTVLFSTHITQDLDAIADFIVFIDSGKLVDSCSKDDFLEKYRIVKGNLEELKYIESKIILGKKISSSGFEILINSNNLSKINYDLLVEIPNIETIMILYGRQNEGYN